MASGCVQDFGAMNPRNVPALSSRGSRKPLVGRPVPPHAVRAHAPHSAHGTQRCAYSMRGIWVKLARPSASLELAIKGIRSSPYRQACRGTTQARFGSLLCPALSPPARFGILTPRSQVTTPAERVKLPPIRTQNYHSRPKESCSNGMGATSARTVCIRRRIYKLVARDAPPPHSSATPRAPRCLATALIVLPLGENPLPTCPPPRWTNDAIDPSCMTC